MKRIMAVAVALLFCTIVARAATSEKEVSLTPSEASILVGSWTSPSSEGKARGVFAFAESLWWKHDNANAQKFGVGLIGAFDWGENAHQYTWGFVAPGVQAGYWKSLGTESAFLIKPRLTYRWNTGDAREVKENCWMPGVYAELSKVASRNNMLSLAYDGWWSKNDANSSLRGYLEHRLNSSWKVKGGLGVTWHETSTEKSTGFSPTLAVKYKSRWTISGTYDSADDGVFSAYVGYDF